MGDHLRVAAGLDLDRSDPAVRAAQRLERLRRRERALRLLAWASLLVAALVLLGTAGPLTGSSGAVLGAAVGALVLLAVAAAVWPAPWSDGELQHHTLDSIWREVRSAAEPEVPWERYAPWAEPAGSKVGIHLITRAPRQARIAGAPSPYRRRLVRSVDGEEVGEAVDAMETLRAEAEEKELAARLVYHEAQERAQRDKVDHQLRAIDAEAAAELQAREAEMRRELAAQERREREEQAAALARALRRP